MKKRKRVLIAGATGALAVSLVFTNTAGLRAHAASNIPTWSIKDPGAAQSSKIKLSKQTKRGTLMARKIPMPRAWHRR